MSDGGANDDADQRRVAPPGGEDDAVERLTLDDPTDGSSRGPTDGPSVEGDGHRERGAREKPPDLELIKPVELDLPDDELAEPPAEGGSTPGSDGQDTPAGREGEGIDGERLLAALVEALRDDHLDEQVAAVRGELTVDPNPELGARLDRLEAAVAERNVEERLKRLEAAVETLTSHETAGEASDGEPIAEPAALDELREELTEVREGLEKLAMHMNERTSAIEPLETHVEELRQWQQAVRAVAVQREED